MEGLPELTAGMTRRETRADALLAKLVSVREEVYAFNVDNAPSPGEFESFTGWIARGSAREHSPKLGRYTEVRVLPRMVECYEA